MRPFSSAIHLYLSELLAHGLCVQYHRPAVANGRALDFDLPACVKDWPWKYLERCEMNESQKWCQMLIFLNLFSFIEFDNQGMFFQKPGDLFLAQTKKSNKKIYTYIIYEKLDHWIMQFKTFYWLSRYGIWANIQYQYGKHTCQRKFQNELKKFPSRSNGGQRKSLRTGVEWRRSNWTIKIRNIREHKESHKIWHEIIRRRAIESLDPLTGSFSFGINFTLLIYKRSWVRIPLSHLNFSGS